MLDKLSVPGLDVAAGTLTLPLWAAGAAVALLLLLLLLAAFRSGFGVVIASLSRIAPVVLAAAGARPFVHRLAGRGRADRRGALQDEEVGGAGKEAGCEPRPRQSRRRHVRGVGDPQRGGRREPGARGGADAGGAGAGPDRRRCGQRGRFPVGGVDPAGEHHE